MVSIRTQPTTSNQNRRWEKIAVQKSWKPKLRDYYISFSMCIGLQFILLITGNRWLQKLKVQFRQTTIAFICIYCLFILFSCTRMFHSKYPFSLVPFALKCAFAKYAAKVLSKKRMSKVKITRERKKREKK